MNCIIKINGLISKSVVVHLSDRMANLIDLHRRLWATVVEHLPKNTLEILELLACSQPDRWTAGQLDSWTASEIT